MFLGATQYKDPLSPLSDLLNLSSLPERKSSLESIMNGNHSLQRNDGPFRVVLFHLWSFHLKENPQNSFPKRSPRTVLWNSICQAVPEQHLGGIQETGTHQLSSKLQAKPWCPPQGRLGRDTWSCTSENRLALAGRGLLTDSFQAPFLTLQIHPGRKG